MLSDMRQITIAQVGLEGLVSKRRDRPYQAGRVEALAQGEEPQESGDEPGDGAR
jgi:hypothetical protein